MVVVGIRIGIVIAVDEPHFGHLENRGQFDFQRTLCLQIAQEHDGGRTVAGNRFQHMLEVAMGVAEKIDHARSSCHGPASMPRFFFLARRGTPNCFIRLLSGSTILSGSKG
jgi:hypothetical protein